MKIQNRWEIFFIICLAGWIAASCDSYTVDTPKAAAEVDIPVFMSMQVIDDTREGLAAKEKQLQAAQALGNTAARSAIATIDLDALNVDFRKTRTIWLADRRQSFSGIVRRSDGGRGEYGYSRIRRFVVLDRQDRSWWIRSCTAFLLGKWKIDRGRNSANQRKSKVIYPISRNVRCTLAL